ncbi:replicative DNA helicase [Actinomyces sp. MRS3W]|uniref:replicative DNA helicase n=1 Tax=Actinomyces sp. MRS3W TaxID=2800796 RepID=UPI0028FD6346|nr:replicative DNA helicase [Actinomyces sp. MRS3W]MDU0348016.1 replicative DNA helicase [Actinomyces sp. MRS3W]
MTDVDTIGGRTRNEERPVVDARYDGAFDRVPPQDLEAEMSTLGGMLLSKEAITDVIEVLRGPEFYKPAHESIFDAIVEVYNRSEPADPLIVADELSKRGELERIGGAPYLATLMATVPTAANAAYYARIVKEKSLMRGLVQAGTRIAQLGYSTDAGDIDELVTLAESEVYAVAHKEGEREDYIAVGELLNEANLEIEAGQAREDGQMRGVPTGFVELDELLGGLHGGQMIIVAARPAMGKSTLAVDFCRSASLHARGADGGFIPSCYFSLEMGRMELMMRILAAESGVALNKLRGGSQMDERDWEDVARAYNPVSEAPLFIDDSPNLTMPEIRSKALRLKQQHGLGLMVVDYLQLMSSGKQVESRQQEVSEFSRSLKLLAKELDIPVIAVAQLNRGPEQRTGNKPQMSDLRESGSLEQDADVIMLLHRPEYYQEEERPGEADIIVAKHRNGQTRTIPVAFQGHLSRFANMARNITPEPAYE